MFFLSPKKLTRMQTFCMKLSPTLATLHPNTSGLLFIFFYKLLRALILFENLQFFSKLYILPWVGKISNLWCSNYWKMHFRVKKVELYTFIHVVPGKTLPQVLIIISLGTSKLLIFSKQRFLKIYFPPAEREEDYRAEKRPKLNLRGNWSQSSINSSIFQPLHFCFLFCCSII